MYSLESMNMGAYEYVLFGKTMKCYVYKNKGVYSMNVKYCWTVYYDFVSLIHWGMIYCTKNRMEWKVIFK